MTPEERLMRSLPALRALADSLAAYPPSEARELLRLDFLVRKYPAAARMSMQRRQRTDADLPVPPQGRSSVLDTGGLPLWRWAAGPALRSALGVQGARRRSGSAGGLPPKEG